MIRTVIQRYDTFKKDVLDDLILVEYIQFVGTHVERDKVTNEPLLLIVFDISAIRKEGQEISRLIFVNHISSEYMEEYEELPIIGLGNAPETVANRYVILSCFHKYTTNNFRIYAKSAANENHVLKFIFEIDEFIYVQRIMQDIYSYHEVYYDTGINLLKMRSNNNCPPKTFKINNREYLIEVIKGYIDPCYKSIFKRAAIILAKIKFTPIDENGNPLYLDRFFLLMNIPAKKRDIKRTNMIEYKYYSLAVDEFMDEKEKIYYIEDHTDVEYSFSADQPIKHTVFATKALHGDQFAYFSFTPESHKTFSEIIYNTFF